MRLINVKTLELEEFFDSKVPAYAILSHTWDKGETTFSDWQDKRTRTRTPGYSKIARACALARAEEYDYIWIDTNCINKDSSAELSEAINSMFRYYHKAHICFVYLVDVPWADLATCEKDGSPFRLSRWFTRGWTLQELIAPLHVRFYSKDWRILGTKRQLISPIAEITGISQRCLDHTGRSLRTLGNTLQEYSVAQRLAWASRRSTSRIEDQAYCLLGLFNIHMPLLYGEGKAAFRRLIEEIVGRYPDQTFLCSQLPDSRENNYLPASPVDFQGSQHILPASRYLSPWHYLPVHDLYQVQIANIGIQITAPLITTFSRNLAFVVLDCWGRWHDPKDKSQPTCRVWIPLHREGGQKYYRTRWPQEFFPVRLPPIDIVLGRQQLGGSLGDLQARSVSSQENTAGQTVVVDPVSPDSYQSILITTPILVDPKGLSERISFGPFLICFPRGLADYRLYSVLPDLGEPPHEFLRFSLVQAWELPIRNGNNDDIREHSSDETNGECGEKLYGALLIFKKRGSRPSRFAAVCLINAKEYVTGEAEPHYRPLCKVLPHWNPDEPRFLDGIDVGTFRDVDEDGSTMVIVQKQPGNNPEDGGSHVVGLVQIIFDLKDLREEIQRSKVARNRIGFGMLKYYGRDSPEEDI